MLNVTAEDLAQKFHETYEKLAPQHGYRTRPESAVEWAKVPIENRRLMIAVAYAVLEWANTPEECHCEKCWLAKHDTPKV